MILDSLNATERCRCGWALTYPIVAVVLPGPGADPSEISTTEVEMYMDTIQQGVVAAQRRARRVIDAHHDECPMRGPLPLGVSGSIDALDPPPDYE